MDFTDQFAVRYYEWSLERVGEELRDRFPLLSKVRNPHSFKLLELVQRLSPAEQEHLLVALVKRFHVRAGDLGKFVISPAEQELIDLYLNTGYVKQSNGKIAMLPFASERERRIREELDLNAAKRPDRKAIKKLVTRNLTNGLGAPTRNRGGTVEFESSIPNWTITTDIDFAHTWGPMISYSHVIIPEGDLPLQPSIHICGWMGLAGQTTWDLYTADDTEEVADSIVMLISWFLGRWRELVPAPVSGVSGP
jgi:hypothetical protein